jgi:hypothetical protein
LKQADLVDREDARTLHRRCEADDDIAIGGTRSPRRDRDRIGELKFRHPMIKSVVVERSTHDERRATHQRLAEPFADQPERRGHHLAEAADAALW